MNRAYTTPITITYPYGHLSDPHGVLGGGDSGILQTRHVHEAHHAFYTRRLCRSIAAKHGAAPICTTFYLRTSQNSKSSSTLPGVMKSTSMRLHQKQSVAGSKTLYSYVTSKTLPAQIVTTFEHTSPTSKTTMAPHTATVPHSKHWGAYTPICMHSRYLAFHVQLYTK